MTAVEVLAAHQISGTACSCGGPLRPVYADVPWDLDEAAGTHQLDALADAGFRVVPAEAARSDLGGLAAREAGA